jgi:hypothetical protein
MRVKVRGARQYSKLDYCNLESSNFDQQESQRPRGRGLKNWRPPERGGCLTLPGCADSINLNPTE